VLVRRARVHRSAHRPADPGRAADELGEAICSRPARSSGRRNNIAFALLYWELDGGGSAARAQGQAGQADFAFPQQAEPRLAAPGWRPLFIDYLYWASPMPPRSAPPMRCRSRPGQDRHDRAVTRVARNPRAGHRASGQRTHLVRGRGYGRRGDQGRARRRQLHRP
jgi:hypothetical protein